MSYLNRPLAPRASLESIVRNTGLLLLSAVLVACGSNEQAAEPTTASDSAVVSAPAKGSAEHIREVTNLTDENIAAAVCSGALADLYGDGRTAAPPETEELLALASSLRWQLPPFFHDALVESIYA